MNTDDASREGSLVNTDLKTNTDGAQRLSGTPASLTLRGIEKHYGTVRAVDGVDLEIQSGEFVTFLGPSGSGKTTTLQIIAGFVEATAGQVLLDGERVTAPPHKRNIGMVFQNYALFPHMTAAQNVGYPLKVRKVSKNETRQRVNEALEMVGLADRGDRYPKQLSGGQQQRIALARALVFRPKIVLLDEPLGALDKNLREHLQLEIKRIQHELGITMIYVTHDQEEALVMSDRIAVFNEGRIEQLGDPEEVYEHPSSRFVADFIGESNIFRGRLEKTSSGFSLNVGSLRLSVPSGARLAKAGSSAALVVRPERLRVRSLREGPGDGDNALEARVKEVVYLGNERKYNLVTPTGETLIGRHQVGAVGDEPRVGDSVTVYWRGEESVLVPDDREDEARS